MGKSSSNIQVLSRAFQILRIIKKERDSKISLGKIAKISKCGSISPRFKVKKNEYAEWEQQYLPSYSRGMLIVTTNQGVMSHHDASNKGIGGLLIGYVY